jgi:hypothetical protein
MDSMDTGQQSVEAHIAEIKAYMPETYKSIQAKAAKVGNTAYALVKRSLKGEANCFWACERGWVKGTPFSTGEIQRDVAQYMVSLGCAHVCIFATTPEEMTDGTH